MNVIDFLRKDRYAAHLGIELTEASAGMAKAKLIIKDHHLNAVNNVQGGALFSLADLCLAAAANSYGNIAVTLNANISFLMAAREGTLLAEATEISRNNRIATYTVRITNEDNELVATAQGMVYVKNTEF